MPTESRGKAVANEQEVWAAIEIQRHWRGYKGRVHAENAWEQVPSALGWTHLKNGWLLAKNQPSMGTGCHGSIQCDITMNENGGFTLQVGVAFLGGRGKGD